MIRATQATAERRTDQDLRSSVLRHAAYVRRGYRVAHAVDAPGNPYGATDRRTARKPDYLHPVHSGLARGGRQRSLETLLPAVAVDDARMPGSRHGRSGSGISPACTPRTDRRQERLCAVDGPTLQILLQRHGVLIVNGGETDVCVLATVLGAIDRGYRVVVASDAICSSADETHDASLRLYQGLTGNRLR
jgi:nicotinamidase-related amidase